MSHLLTCFGAATLPTSCVFRCWCEDIMNTVTCLFCLLVSTLCAEHMINGFHLYSSTAAGLRFVDHILKETAVFLNAEAGYRLANKGEALKTSLHDVIFAVKQQNLDQLNQVLYEVSDPQHPKYGQHWDRQQVVSLISNPAATDSVKTYLTDRGIHVEKVSKYGEYIQASATIAQWEALFQTKFYEFYDEAHHITFTRALEYSLPALIYDHLTGVLGVADYFPPTQADHKTDALKKISQDGSKALKSLKTMKQLGNIASNTGKDSSPTLLCFDSEYFLCLAYPQLLYEYYNVSSPFGTDAISQGIYGTLDQTFSPVDLTTFQQQFNVTVHPIAGSINGHVYNNACYVSIDNCDEASLDIQYITSIAQSVPTYYYYYPDSSLNGFANWLVDVSEMANPPDLFSISYGGNEAGTSSSSIQLFNTEAQKLGVMGVSLINSSGDNGAPGSNAVANPGRCAYRPAFPSSSPYVTSVGATQGPEFGNPEIVCQVPNSVITSGGGFSAQNTRPSWQSSVVATYFQTAAANNESPVSGYTVGGRGYPDVAIMGNNYAVVLNGSLNVLSGTSASSPVFAGMISLANAQRREAGLSTLGFLNPMLYGNYGAFIHDITTGNNKCTSAYDGYIVNNTAQYVGTCCTEGFYATPGWDPVTGLGSLDVAKFLDFVTTTPAPSFAPSFAPANISPAPTTSRPSTYHPSTRPTMEPTTRHPTAAPSHAPTTLQPSVAPTAIITILPTAIPTLPPTFFPSFAPSQQTSTVLSFESTIKLTNLSFSTDYSLTGADQQAVIDATASSMGLNSNQVTFVSSSVSVARKRALRDEISTHSLVWVHPTTISIPGIVYATVMTSVLVVDSSSPQQTYVELAGALTYSVYNSTAFDEYLHSAAKTVGSTVMTSAVANSVTQEQPTVQTILSNDDGSSNNSLSIGALAGIVVGGIFGVAFIGVAIYCIFAASFSRPTKGLAERGGDGIPESSL